MPSGIPYSEEVKKACIQELADGGSLEAVAKKHKVGVSTLRKWRAKPMQRTKAPAKAGGSHREAIVLLKQAVRAMPKTARPTRSELLTMLALSTLEGEA